MNKNEKITRAISWFALLYFVILFAERLQSLIRAVGERGWWPSMFFGVVNIMSAVSLGAAVIMLLIFNRDFLKSLFSPVEPDWSMLAVTSGVILISGMVHTEYTIAGIQFAAYGMLIVAMILRTVLLAPQAKSLFSLWYSLVYLTAFSMAIPVVYHSELPHAAVFHLLEATVMLFLVFFFTVMLRNLFTGKGENLLTWMPFLVMASGDAVVLVMRWDELVNTFVLVAACATALIFIVGKIIIRR